MLSTKLTHAQVGSRLISNIHRKVVVAPRQWAAGLMANFMNELSKNHPHRNLTIPGLRLRLPEVKDTLDFIGIQYYTRE
jgi:hypothetical protein